MSTFVNSDFSTGTPGADLITFTGGAGETFAQSGIILGPKNLLFTATSPHRIRSDTSVGEYALYKVNEAPPGPDYTVTVRGHKVADAESDLFIVRLRTSLITGQSYEFVINGGTLSLNLPAGGSPTPVSFVTPIADGGDFTAVYSAEGSTLRCDVTPDGGSTTTISATDTTISVEGHIVFGYARGAAGTIDDTKGIHFSSLMAATSAPSTTDYDWDDPSIRYVGHWSGGNTITNGSSCRFGFTGNTCVLRFDVAAMDHRPGIAYWIDGTGPTRVAPIGADGTVTITPTYGTGTVPVSATHLLRFDANVYSGYPTASYNWQSLQNAIKFLGVTVGLDQTLFPTPELGPTCEGFGDSITAGLRTLYDGVNDDVAHCAPSMSWFRLACEFLGLEPVYMGHGGGGITHPATDGTPAAAEAMGFCYDGAAYTPDVDPVVATVYFGWTETGITQSEYQGFLTAVRARYPHAYIFAAAPHGLSLGSVVSGAVAARVTAGDARVFGLDYSTGVVASEDTVDTVHLSPGGNVSLGARFATDIRETLDSLGVRLQAVAPGAAPAPVVASSFLIID